MTPVITKTETSISQHGKLAKKKKASEIIYKRTKTDIEESLGHINHRADKLLKSKRDTSLYSLSLK